jgi:hypothetical protein
LYASALFTADATVANRFLAYRILDAAGHQIAFGQNSSAVVASSTITVNVGQGYTQQNTPSGNTFLPLVTGIVIPPNGQFQFNAANIDAGDTWTAIDLVFAGSTNGSATLTVGNRTFQLNYASGLFLATSIHGLQLDNTGTNNKAVLTISPASAVHLEIAGTADNRKIDRM